MGWTGRQLEALSCRQFTFAERTATLIGRENECHISFPKTKDYQTVSRHHCLLDINPPAVRIRDLGSRSGTYVNGHLIGKRDSSQSAAEGAKLRFAEHDLADGDEIKLGCVVLRVRVAAIAAGSDSSLEPPDIFDPAGPVSTLPTSPPTLLTDNLRKPTPAMRQGENDPQEQAASPTDALEQLPGYRIEKELGRGGMGAVYLALHEASGARVALKTMLPQMATTARLRDQFLREAAVTKVLRHRHVVELRDLEYSEDRFFFTLDYCEGGSVADWLKKSGKLPAEKAVPLVLQALEGLDYAHRVDLPAVRLADGTSARANGLVHRDIKPGNILLASEDKGYVPKISDYGLAKAFDLAGLSGLSMTGQVGGTSGFMPRQQLLDYRNVRPAVDIWAMAATLYYMLTLTTPRIFKKGADGLQIVLQTDAVPIRQRLPTLPNRLASVIDHALRERPAIGFQTAAEFREALSGTLKNPTAVTRAITLS